MAILEVNNIEKHFGSTSVLKDVSFSLEEGSALAIIGSSGSGKTTLLRCLNFLETPNGGTIKVKGETLFDASLKQKRKESELRTKRLHFGMVFQSFNLFPQYTALENVTLAEKLLAKERPDFRTAKKEIYDKINSHGEELLAQMGLAERMDHYPHQLSGGQQQRVSIGRALMNSPAVVLADEPTGALDSKSGEQIMELFQKLNEEGVTIVMITHDPHIASNAKRMVKIIDGEIFEGDEKEDAS